MNIKTASIEALQNKYTIPLPDTIAESLSKQPVISGICLYPIKSCTVLNVKSWPVSKTGLYLDRHWCIATKSQNRPLKASPNILYEIIYSFIDLDKNILIIASPRMAGNNFILTIDNHKEDCRKFTMPKNQFINILADCGDEVGDWLNEALDTENLCLLEQIGDREDDMSLTWDSQIQLMNADSIRKLADELASEYGYFDQDLGIFCNRFRANLIIEGVPSYQETAWKEVQINEITLEIVESVVRCTRINLNTERLEYEINTLQYLQRKHKGKPIFGMHSFIKDFKETAIINIGDPFAVLSAHTNDN